MKALIHHGTPLTPRAALLDVCAGRAMCVSFFRPDDVEAVEAVSPAIMFRQRRVQLLDAGDALRAGMGTGSRLDALLPLAGAAPVSSGPVGGDTGQPRRAVTAQRWDAERLAVWADGCAALAHGRAYRKARATVRAIRARLSRLDWRPEEGAGGLRCLPPPHGRGGQAIRQPLARHSHDARDAGGVRLSVRKRGQHLSSSEWVAI